MIGMLWYDNSRETLTRKIERALDYYRDKFGEEPNTIAVNPTDALAGIPAISDIRIVPDRMVARNYMLIGVANDHD
jgi:hypothetical protein